jgi:hypothetical protein
MALWRELVLNNVQVCSTNTTSAEAQKNIPGLELQS